MKNSNAQQKPKFSRALLESLKNLEKSIEDLRITMKYQVFDLEATRRENKILRKENEVLKWKLENYEPE